MGLISIAFWIAVGLVVGWFFFPRPAWADRIWTWIKSFFVSKK